MSAPGLLLRCWSGGEATTHRSTSLWPPRRTLAIPLITASNTVFAANNLHVVASLCLHTFYMPSAPTTPVNRSWTRSCSVTLTKSSTISCVAHHCRQNSCSCGRWRLALAIPMCTWRGVRCGSSTAAALAAREKSLSAVWRPAPGGWDSRMALLLLMTSRLQLAQRRRVSILDNDANTYVSGHATDMMDFVQECATAAGVGGDGGGGGAP
jgi:hypothetical protein